MQASRTLLTLLWDVPNRDHRSSPSAGALGRRRSPSAPSGGGVGGEEDADALVGVELELLGIQVAHAAVDHGPVEGYRAGRRPGVQHAVRPGAGGCRSSGRLPRGRRPRLVDQRLQRGERALAILVSHQLDSPGPDRRERDERMFASGAVGSLHDGSRDGAHVIVDHRQIGSKDPSIGPSRHGAANAVASKVTPWRSHGARAPREAWDERRAADP